MAPPCAITVVPKSVAIGLIGESSMYPALERLTIRENSISNLVARNETTLGCIQPAPWRNSSGVPVNHVEIDITRRDSYNFDVPHA